jgi:hypothetical protein
MEKKVLSAISFICSACQGEDLKVERAVRTGDGMLYFTFICLDCEAINNVDMTVILQSLYTVPFADGGKSVN